MYTANPICSPYELKSLLPLSLELAKEIEAFKVKAKNIANGYSSQKVIVVGPCSLYDETAIYDYAKKLAELQKNSSLYIVMRAFFEKPRSKTGWKGYIYDPFLENTTDIQKGLYETRKLLLKLVCLHIPLACEIVNPLFYPYIDDLISWSFIGARTSSSQIHRELSSSLDIPVGFKNNIDGNIKSAIDSVYAAQQPQAFLTQNQVGKLVQQNTKGNPYTHLVLRGSQDQPNYQNTYIQKSIELMESQGILPRLLVDCSHGNSQKDPEKQIDVFLETVNELPSYNNHIIGTMIESHLYEGIMPITSPAYGFSITDPCLGFDKTKKLILDFDHLPQY